MALSFLYFNTQKEKREMKKNVIAFGVSAGAVGLGLGVMAYFAVKWVKKSKEAANGYKKDVK